VGEGVSARAGPSRRSTPADWCRAGLALLRDEGPSGVTLERLCASLGRTKGSFYHHFRGLHAFQTALLAEWEEQHTGRPIAAASHAEGAARRSALLDAVVLGIDHDLDRAVRAWGRHDARVREAVRRVDARRMGYLVDLHRDRGRSDARGLAELEYAVFLGAQELELLADAERGPALRRALAAALQHLAGTSARPATGRRMAGRR
jgi:AcrR family transcriptional regulator